MKLAIFLLLCIGLVVLWAYLKMPPAYVNKRLVTVFNRMALALTFLFSLLFYLNARVRLPLSDDLREIVALAGALGVEIVFLIVCFLLRNFWIFKPPRRPGGGLF